MKQIIDAIDKQVIKDELKKARLLKTSPYGNHEIYVFTNNDSPILMREVGRLREITFRQAGGGTGESLDIDEYDTGENLFSQLIVYNPQTEEIMGGYRYITGDKIKVENNILMTPTGKLFECTTEFHEEITPYMIELGRSFVIPEYQASSEIKKGIFVLENLWIGLGAIVLENQFLKYTFGKITMYPDYNVFARDILLNFLDRYFPGDENLCKAIVPIKFKYPVEELNKYFEWNNYEQDYQTLIQVIKNNGETIPPLVNSYMNLSKTMKVFGTAINDHFGNVEETGILITIDDIVPAKLERYGLRERVTRT
ncbi:GNAT family N-acetyltransferase [Odoribacter sp. OttesenSCG-928-L07]|nr:GNAT family N-acetyltransferase [Odoribacter sp. OttesenSCG-928-L07]MDL2239202.1 GNAT family N-acetyltransferase [Bacteroidales bacterium OttesenSCG-928-L14]MDL2240546.1 GNAT family N-acetyltransferase [Bacteroidales bacterium OttesenSCG-928-K22]